MHCTRRALQRRAVVHLSERQRDGFQDSDPSPPSAASGVCVIVAARNAHETIGRCVTSALIQPEVAQVIVVDDASTDATALAAFDADDGSGRLTLLTIPENRGPAAARNLALATASAALVCVLDADDWLQSGRFARMLANVSEPWDLLADDLLLAPEATPDRPTSSLLGLAGGERQDCDLTGFVAANIPDTRRPRRELGYLKPLMRRSFLERAGLRYDESLRLGEDFVLYTRALLHGGRFLVLPACGYVAVQRNGSLSRTHGTADLAALVDAIERLVDEARRLRPDAVPVLKNRLLSDLRKLEYRRALDAKRNGDWIGVARQFLRSPATTAYIVGETLRARASRHLGKA
jgi:succinoglycan biosynthesis protein ExoU